MVKTALEEVLNLILMICADFEYLDNPTAAECDPSRYYEAVGEGSMAALLSAMIMNIVVNDGKSDFDRQRVVSHTNPSDDGIRPVCTMHSAHRQ